MNASPPATKEQNGRAPTGLPGVIRKAWEILSQKDNERTQVAFAVVVIFWISLLGALGALVFGFTARSGDFGSRLSGGVIATLACVGAFAVGGILGLLFGSPTTGSTGTQGSSTDGNQVGIGVRPNTSLERIADWLTTMIVGLGLVNLRPILNEATAMSVWLTQAITHTASTNGSPGAAIALGFSFAGFSLVYLWSMRFLPSELRDSYADLKQRLDEAETQNEALRNFKKNTESPVPEGTLEQIRTRLSAASIPSEIVGDVLARYRVSTKISSEPMRNFGPIESEGFRLAAHIVEVGAGKFSVSVKVIDKASSSNGQVYWLLHNTFTPDVLSECPIDQGYSTIIDEPFWVGALIPRKDAAPIQLSIDLGQVEGAPATFKNI